MPNAPVTERELQHAVTRRCDDLGLPWIHDDDPRLMTPGWPDLVIIGRRLLFRELKNDWRRLDPAQMKLGYQLAAAGQDFAVWRPRDWASGRIERELKNLV